MGALRKVGREVTPPQRYPTSPPLMKDPTVVIPTSTVVATSRPRGPNCALSSSTDGWEEDEVGGRCSCCVEDTD